MAKIKPENCTNCEWFDRLWHRCTNVDSRLCAEWVGVSDKCSKFVGREKNDGDLQGQLDLGRRVLPMGDCEGFDYQTGCPGHDVEVDDGS